MLDELRRAVRSLGRAPAFTTAAVLTLALGIGVNTAVFSVVHVVLLDPLPFRDPQRLVHLAQTHPDIPSMQATAPDFFDWQRDATSFSGLSAYTFQAMNKWNIRGDGDPEEVQVVQASASLFPMLGVEPLIGRSYNEEEERLKQPVVLISETLWRRRYHADRNIIGRQIRLVDWPVTVIGVVARGTAQPSWADVWMGLGFLDAALTSSRRFHPLEVIGRLKPGVTVEQAQSEMSTLAAGMAEAYPSTNARAGVTVVPLASWMNAEVRPALLIAWSAVVLVLLLACANIAHLLLVRTMNRSGELAIRSALGAGAARLASLLLMENFVIAVAGGLLGLFSAALAMPAIRLVAESRIQHLAVISLSPQVMIFSVAATFACAVFTIVPAIAKVRRAGSVRQTSRGRLSVARLILGVEIALALGVIASAATLYRSFARLMSEDTGIDAREVMSIEWSMLAQSWDGAAKTYRDRLEPSLRALPGVDHVAAVNTAPMAIRRSESTRFTTRFGLPGQSHTGDPHPLAQLRWITPDYFPTLRIRIVGGRAFAEHDFGHPVYIINEAMARRYFGGRNPVGATILLNVLQQKPDKGEVVGVARDVRDLALDTTPEPTIYSLGVSSRMTLLLRGAVAPSDVRAALRAATPDAVVRINGPLEDMIAESVALRRFALEMIAGFAVLAALLTAVGVYGLVRYSLSLRAREFAIRFAIGAGRGEVGRQLGRDFALPVVAGLVLGTWLAYAGALALETQLYKTAPFDPAVLGLSGAGVALMLCAAAWRPVTRAAAISPAALLRNL